jgi:hypothetical protein
MLRRLLELIVLRMRSERSKELEILVLRQQLHVLRRQVARPRLRSADRILVGCTNTIALQITRFGKMAGVCALHEPARQVQGESPSTGGSSSAA